jgi:hypothetical protein
MEMDLDLNHTIEGDNGLFVFNTINNMLSYSGRSVQKKKTASDKEKSSEKEEKSSKILIKEIGYYTKMPMVSSLQDIPPMFYWYSDKKKTEDAGIYCCILPGVYAKVPFPEVIDNSEDFSRAKSICCKYFTKENCENNREIIARQKSTSVRSCNFAHNGDKYVKISTSSRCPRRSTFGSPSTLVSDINEVGMHDIKQIMLYGISDLISAYVWFDNKKNITKKSLNYQFMNLETCSNNKFAM